MSEEEKIDYKTAQEEHAIVQKLIGNNNITSAQDLAVSRLLLHLERANKLGKLDPLTACKITMQRLCRWKLARELQTVKGVTHYELLLTPQRRMETVIQEELYFKSEAARVEEYLKIITNRLSTLNEVKTLIQDEQESKETGGTSEVTTETGSDSAALETDTTTGDVSADTDGGIA